MPDLAAAALGAQRAAAWKQLQKVLEWEMELAVVPLRRDSLEQPADGAAPLWRAAAET